MLTPRPLSIPAGQMLNPAVAFAVHVMFHAALAGPYTGPRHFADSDARLLRHMAALRGFPLFIPAGAE